MKRLFSLKGRKYFQEVIQKGKRYYSEGVRLVVFRVIESKGMFFDGNHKERCPANPKIGITIGKKFGNAVERNRAKRQVRAIVRDMVTDLMNNTILIISIYKEFRELNYQQARRKIERIIDKAGLLKHELDK